MRTLVHRRDVRLNRERSEEGDALVEFALIGISLLMVIFAIVGFGETLYAYNIVSEAAREGTRYAIVRGATCTGWATACPAAASDIQTYVQGILSKEIYVNPASTGAWTVKVNTTWPANNPGCVGTPANSPGCTVQVQVQYNFTLTLAFIKAMPMTITSASDMVITQ
jgi:Flp pilus assembly protein TadG